MLFLVVAATEPETVDFCDKGGEEEQEEEDEEEEEEEEKEDIVFTGEYICVLVK